MLLVQAVGEIIDRKKKNEKKSNIASRLQILILLLFSCFFLGSVDIKFFVCTIALTVITYFCGIIIEKNEAKLPKTVLVTGIVLCLGMLGYFKYCNFFVSNIALLFGRTDIFVNVILPIGISFYTFTAISYLVDVYRGKYCAEKNIINFCLFISFFAKVTAGPISRGDEFLPQIKKYNGLKLKDFETGIQIFVLGLFKKIVLADRLGVFVNDVFFAPIAYHTVTIILAVISYSIQIYMDFSGYSDMAIGISKILGFDISKNFNLPYISSNISEFWKRWHISLSSWFRDYLYIPLGGSKKGKYRTLLNLLVVMICSGLWHGAGWTFIIWGLLYGITNCIYSVWKNREKSKIKKQYKVSIVNVFANFILVSLFWVVFRADSISNALQVYKGMFTYHEGIMHPYTWSFFAILCLIIETGYSLIKSKNSNEKYINASYPILNLSKVTSLVIFFTFAGLTLMLGYFGNNAFIYGKF